MLSPYRHIYTWVFGLCLSFFIKILMWSSHHCTLKQNKPVFFFLTIYNIYMQHLKRIKNEPYYQSALLLYFNNVSKGKKKKRKLIPYRKYWYMQQMVALLQLRDSCIYKHWKVLICANLFWLWFSLNSIYVALNVDTVYKHRNRLNSFIKIHNFIRKILCI